MQRYVHRISYELACGEIPPGMCVCHRCDNPRCINPEHLFLGTDMDNMADRDAKGRQASGDRNGNAKLTWQQVEAIRREYRESKTPKRALAAKYGVSEREIRYIAHGDIWNRKPGKEDYGKV